jgi:hypothetical protein
MPVIIVPLPSLLELVCQITESLLVVYGKYLQKNDQLFTPLICSSTSIKSFQYASSSTRLI